MGTLQWHENVTVARVIITEAKIFFFFGSIKMSLHNFVSVISSQKILCALLPSYPIWAGYSCTSFMPHTHVSGDSWIVLFLSPQVIVSRGAENDGPSQRGVFGQGEFRAGQQHGRSQGPASQAASAGAERQPPGPGQAGQHRGQTHRGAVQTHRPPDEDLPQER